MDAITIDFETYYSREYSLTKQTTEGYINDFKFEVIGVAVKVNDEPTKWFSGTMQETKVWLKQFDWDNSIVIAHNALFDAPILAWKFGINPKAIVCTLCMGRALHSTEVGGSLAKLGEYYSVGVKGTEVVNALGKRRVDFSEPELDAYASYCINDVDMTYRLFRKMLPKFTVNELKLIDMTIKMFSDPVLHLDNDVLVAHLQDVQDEKERLLAECSVDKAELMSNQKLANVLEELGVEIPMKTNAKGKLTYAFAKTDEAFKALAEHEDPKVQAIVAARLGTKSTLEETRTQRFIDIANRPGRNSLIPVPLQYYGARTGRWAATDSINLQNLPRKSKLKQAIVAPKGHVIVGADLSNIELRVGLCFAGQMDKLKLLADGVDLYKDFASTVYNIPIEEVNDTQRFMGKTCIAEGELVLSNRGLIPIQDIKLDDKVWDGVEWVSHDGLIYQGEKDVITYQGLTATADHIVYLSDGTKCEFQEAASNNYKIAITGNEGSEVPFMDNSFVRNQQEGEEKHSAHLSKMRLREGNLANSRQFSVWKNKAMPVMRGHTKAHKGSAFDNKQHINGSAPETSKCYVPKMHQPKRQGVQKLWRTGNSLYVLVCSGVRGIHDDAATLFNRVVSRPHRQQWALCSGESSFYIPEGANQQQTEYLENIVGRRAYISSRVEAKPLCTDVNSLQVCTPRVNWRRDYSQSLGVSEQQMQRMAQVERKVRVYDILNAGPRHRFTVNNLLVSNCQLSLIYGTGATKLRNQVKLMGKVDIGEVEAKRIVRLYRDEYTGVVSAWEQGEEALYAVYNNTHATMGKDDLIAIHGSAGALLPSGLYMRYPDLKYSDTVENNRVRREWSVLKRRNERDKLYGSKVFQGLTQAMARCIMAESMLRIGKEHKIALCIHDAVYLVAPENEADDVLRLVIAQLKIPPAWMPEVPLDAEGGYGHSLDFKMHKVM